MKKTVALALLIALILTMAACGSTDEPDYQPYQTQAEPPVESAPPLEEPIIPDDLEEMLPIIAHAFPEMASAEREGEITHIVIHFISNVIANREDPYVMEEVVDILLRYELSAHYIIDRDGTIYLTVPEYRVAFHAGFGTLADFPEYENNLNQHSIGIELLGIGTQEEMSLYLTAEEFHALDPALIGFTDEQYIALNWLINQLLARHPGVLPNRTHIIGHDEYSPANNDPGALFQWDRLDFMQAFR